MDLARHGAIAPGGRRLVMVGMEGERGDEGADRERTDRVEGNAAEGHRLLDRSKVRILLCDNDPKSSQEVFQLLLKCSYQVTSVRSARQVVDALNAQGSEIDIILTEIELPMAKGLKMLKYIARNKELRHIPIITMSVQDEVSVVVKCLRLGAADYLMKPLRTNELLNIWTHMWRRRRMLDMIEKDVFLHGFEMPTSEPSDANTNSTTLISDDTYDKLNVVSNRECISNHPECESNVYPSGLTSSNPSGGLRSVPKYGDMTAFPVGLCSVPNKIELKVGESSAFFTYVKSSAPSRTALIGVDMNSVPSKIFNHKESSVVDIDTDIYNSDNLNNVKDFQTSSQYPALCLSSSPEQLQNETPTNVSAVPPFLPLPYCYPGMIDQNTISSAGKIFQSSLNDVHTHHAQTLLPHYVMSHMPLMQSFHCQPLGVNLQSSHMAAPNVSSSTISLPAPEIKNDRTEKRAAALVKFRQKRKDRCFNKKIRYINRKYLANKRPRVRGQFVKQANSMDLNCGIFTGVDGDSDYEEDDESTSKELELISSGDQYVFNC